MVYLVIDSHVSSDKEELNEAYWIFRLELSKSTDSSDALSGLAPIVSTKRAWID